MPKMLSKLNLNTAFSSRAACWGKFKRSLNRTQFEKLLNTGICSYQFSAGREVLLTVREADEEYWEYGSYVALEALDPGMPQQPVIETIPWNGHFHFTVEEDRPIAKAGSVDNIWIPFADAVIKQLESKLGGRFYFRLRQGLQWGSEPLHIKGEVAFYVKPEYRKQNNNGFDGFSHLLMSTGARIAIGLGADVFQLGNIAGVIFTGDVAGRDKLFTYYAGEFGAVESDRGIGEMEISLKDADL